TGWPPTFSNSYDSDAGEKLQAPGRKFDVEIISHNSDICTECSTRRLGAGWPLPFSNCHDSDAGGQLHASLGKFDVVPSWKLFVAGTYRFQHGRLGDRVQHPDFEPNDICGQ